MKTKQDIIDYLVRESDGQFKEEELKNMDGYGLLDAYFQWEGLIGWTSTIISVVKASGVINK